MFKADMHCHSKFSKHPSEWFLQRLGAAESYTEPDFLYQTMKQRGMDFVTVTDHNCMRASKYLNDKYPDDTFTGTEATAYFPEDGCKIHVLIYGFTEEQFEKIQEYRRDIYALRDYLLHEELAHSVAHATYSVNGKLTMEHMEKLILLFDIFEGINGARGRLHNNTWVSTLESLTPEKIEKLKQKYPHIAPASEDAWVKGFTGGSDDHGGLFLGKTYTVVQASSPRAYLKCIADKNSYHSGRYSDFHSLAFSIYKIAYDFSRNKKSLNFAGGLFSGITSYIFEQSKPGIIERLKMKGYRFKNRRDENKVNRMLLELVHSIRNEPFVNIDKKLSIVYHKAAEISDEMFCLFLRSMSRDISSVRIEDLFKGVTAALPGIFLSVPFFTSFNHMYKDRKLLYELESELPNKMSRSHKRILWFTDTINDLNGVSVTLRTVGRLAYEKGYELKIVTCLPENELDNTLPPNIMNLDMIHEFSLPYYEKQKIRIPSVLRALEEIYAFEPDEVYISTPGPVGLTGLLASKLLHVKSTGIYHTDFSMEVSEIAGNESLTDVVESYTKWFFESCTELKTTSSEYLDVLEDRGVDRERMSVFERGIDIKNFTPKDKSSDENFTIAYAGRISKDKNLSLLIDIYSKLRLKHPNLRLVMAGDGPFMDDIKKFASDKSDVDIKGRLAHEEMVSVYNSADLFVFPSNTDTFGMVVLEAQACGLPAVVSDMGGPKGIVRDNVTGRVLRANDTQMWMDTIEQFIDMKKTDADKLSMYGRQAREHIVKTYDWDSVLRRIFSKPGTDGNKKDSNVTLLAKSAV